MTNPLSNLLVSLGEFHLDWVTISPCELDISQMGPLMTCSGCQHPLVHFQVSMAVAVMDLSQSYAILEHLN